MASHVEVLRGLEHGFDRERSPCPVVGEDFLHRLLDAAHFLLVRLVGQEGRMQVAIAHVAEGADLETVAVRDLLDA